MWFDPFVNHFIMTAATTLSLEMRQKSQPVGLPAEETPRRERRAVRSAAKATRKATR
ncbi:MAG: hypothetical protein GXO37_01010 [Chloroflexi bacterium]|nr:hypothetical protein [Chloroflexota bacterium]